MHGHIVSPPLLLSNHFLFTLLHNLHTPAIYLTPPLSSPLPLTPPILSLHQCLELSSVMHAAAAPKDQGREVGKEGGKEVGKGVQK